MTQQVITFHYELRDTAGIIIDTSQKGEPLIFLEGAGQIIPGLEPALLILEEGKLERVEVPSDEAYGPYDQTLVMQLPRAQFPKPDINPGNIFQVQKGENIQLMTVVEATDSVVTVDANHPLAGKDLVFLVEVTARRDATPEEIAHGHVHPH